MRWLCRPTCLALAAVGGLALALSAGAGPFDSSPNDLQEKAFEQLSTRTLSDWGRHALTIDADHWRHGETPHFIIHYFKRGDKIAVRCEKFYGEIKAFFGNRPDRLGPAKSPVFAFHDRDDWQRFAAQTGLGDIAGVTREDEFFYVTTDFDGRYDSQGKVQAHEMTHLIFNRFFKGRPPLWLNEGIAEYFGQRETSSTVDFRKYMARRGRFPLDRLFGATSYPADPEAVSAFYGEAAVVVDFLSATGDRLKLLPAFVEQMIRTADLEQSLKLYGYANLAEFTEKYERYRKTRY